MSATSPAPFSPEEIAFGLKSDEYEEIVRRLGRHPNKAELGMFGCMWSGALLLQNSPPSSNFTGARSRGPGENAGVVDLGGRTAWMAFEPTTTFSC